MIQDIYTKLRGMISEDRFRHSLGVKETAVMLAQKYSVDIHKASTAGILHDCAKGFSNNELLRIAGECGIPINNIYKNQAELLHGLVGAYIAQKEFLVNDRDILHAIKYHTTGCENMSILDKIIYIADYIEPGRCFPGVEDLRRLTFDDINGGVLAALESTIRHVLDKKQLLDILTIEARNFMLSKDN